MTVLGAFVTPHPPVVVPAVGGADGEGVAATRRALEDLATETARLAPETIVLASPHAGLDRGHMGVSVSGRYRGNLAQFGAPQVSVELEGDPALAESVLRDSLAREIPVLPRGGQQEAHALDHGSLVPLHFLLSRVRRPPRLLLLTFSLLGTPEHLEFGRAVGTAVEVYGRRTLFVASGDLSHRLKPGAPAGFDPRGEEFDRRVTEAFTSGDLESLARLPARMVDGAGECGYRSLLILSGVVEGRPQRSRLLSYEGPFGVGYLVAAVEMQAVEDSGSAADEAVGEAA